MKLFLNRKTVEGEFCLQHYGLHRKEGRMSDCSLSLVPKHRNSSQQCMVCCGTQCHKGFQTPELDGSANDRSELPQFLSHEVLTLPKYGERRGVTSHCFHLYKILYVNFGTWIPSTVLKRPYWLFLWYYILWKCPLTILNV